jgi:hypothetical protein
MGRENLGIARSILEVPAARMPLNARRADTSAGPSVVRWLIDQPAKRVPPIRLASATTVVASAMSLTFMVYLLGAFRSYRCGSAMGPVNSGQGVCRKAKVRIPLMGRGTLDGLPRPSYWSMPICRQFDHECRGLHRNATLN